MDIIEILKAVILGIVQGITEWLPVSSTGHMILVNEFLNLNFSEAFVDMFLVVIQFGSILAVLLLYFHKLNPLSPRKTNQQKRDTIDLWLKVIAASLPLVVGLLLDGHIPDNPIIIAAALIVYGIAFLWMENRDHKVAVRTYQEMTYKTAFLIGCFQILAAAIPGTSRSGATILGAVLLGTSRSIAAEFSFFMAIPAMFGASLLKLIKMKVMLTTPEIVVLITGMAVAFIVSVVVIRFFMNYIKKHDFKIFGYYRIILGILVLVYFVPKLFLA